MKPSTAPKRIVSRFARDGLRKPGTHFLRALYNAGKNLVGK